MRKVNIDLDKLKARGTAAYETIIDLSVKAIKSAVVQTALKSIGFGEISGRPFGLEYNLNKFLYKLPEPKNACQNQINCIFNMALDKKDDYYKMNDVRAIVKAYLSSDRNKEDEDYAAKALSLIGESMKDDYYKNRIGFTIVNEIYES